MTKWMTNNDFFVKKIINFVLLVRIHPQSKMLQLKRILVINFVITQKCKKFCLYLLWSHFMPKLVYSTCNISLTIDIFKSLFYNFYKTLYTFYHFPILNQVDLTHFPYKLIQVTFTESYLCKHDIFSTFLGELSSSLIFTIMVKTQFVFSAIAPYVIVP